MSPNDSKGTIRPKRAGSFPAKRGRKKPCYTRSTTRANQAWKHILDADGKPQPFNCPICKSVIDYDQRGFAGCKYCAWSPSMMTPKERADLEASDPEMVPIIRFLETFEQFAPRFEGHANTKRISGKERRERRFLSKCAAGGQT